jgi:hypothetical protein|tara:strand:+ start:2186 stop:3250 length:1065 start_codon:yes stop_codon:yes gene_type:complete
MTFLNSKEQVIDLQLTSYGRYLLSLGKLKPASYAFFDDDILYDRRYVSGSGAKEEEPQNEIEGRIQENTPRMSAQTIYRGAEIGVFSENSEYVNNLMPGVVASTNKKSSDFLLETPDSSYIFMNPLGNSAYNSKYVAAWDIGFYRAPLLGATGYWIGSNNLIPTTFIPQLECDLRFEFHIYPIDASAPVSKQNDRLFQIEQKYSTNIENNDGSRVIMPLKDDSYMVYVDDFAFLKVEEANTEFRKENFELEVYRIKSEATTTQPEVLERLFFLSDQGTVDEKTVEYYFEIETDFDIDEAEFCQLLNLQQEKVSNIYTDKVFDCSDPSSQLESLNIYDTGENNDIGEPCGPEEIS